MSCWAQLSTQLRIPVDVRWTGPPGERVSAYRLQRRVDGGAWTNTALADPQKPRAVLTLDSWRVYGFRVAATDSAGRLGAWSAERVIRARQALQTEETADYSGSWTHKGALSLLEGATRVASEAGASAEFSVSRRGIAWIATQGPDRGRAAVYVDGVRVATVSLSAATVQYRRVVWTRSWPDTATRKVKILILDAGTRGVDIDGLLVVEPPAPDPLLAGAGDIARCDATGDEQTADLLDGIEGTVFTAGDNVYPVGSSRDFAECYEPTWGRHRERTRPVPGNHEYQTADAAGYKEYFGPAAIPNGTTWYAYDLGAWRIYAMDSECALIGGCDSLSPQGRWLVADLARHPRRCVAAILHRPLFSSGLHRGDMRWRGCGRPSTRRARRSSSPAMSTTTSGSLACARTAPPRQMGCRQFVVGTGGAMLRPFGSVAPNSLVRWNGSHGVLELTLRPASYGWRFVPVGDSTFQDTGSSPCL